MATKSPTEPIVRRVRSFLKTNDLAHTVKPLVVAVSGGPDSLSLLYALYGLRKELGITLHVAHLNHCLRGQESEEDAAYVSRLAGELAIPATIAREDVKLRPSVHSSSLEEKAREARYDFLAKVVEDIGALGAAVAHTADDQVETVLLHMLRGSGTSGLRGMQPVTTINTTSGKLLRLFRPLLEITRKDTETYCKTAGLSPKFDYTNLSTTILRNRIRLELIPYLREYNPSIDASIHRLSDSASLDIAFIEDEVARVWTDVVTETPGSVRIDKEKVRTIAPALRRHLLRKAVETVVGDLVDIEQSHLVALEGLMSKPAGKILRLPRGVVAIMEYRECLLTSEEAGDAGPPSLQGEHDLAIPGTTTLDGWRVTASLVEKGDDHGTIGGLRAALDLHLVGRRVTVRKRRPGDRFQPLGMKHTRKLQDFLVDSKVPSRLRDRIPLVCANGRIVWVVGWRIDERVKITDSTTRVLLLEFQQNEPSRPESES